MDYEPELAELRFGTGLGLAAKPVADADAFLARLDRVDDPARTFPIASFDAQVPDLRRERSLQKRKRQGSTEAETELKALRREMGERQAAWFGSAIARQVDAADGFRERLTRFWADHFTVVGKQGLTRTLAATHAEDAVRPHLAGRFADMLRAAVTHPMMLAYLDQFQSVGEGSMIGERRGKGLNENLAREILELHTLGVGGAYTQTDVREFANLLAGFTYDRQGRVTYFPRRGSPGAETVLGRSYGGKVPKLDDVHQALNDIAVHPDTARHIARKLAVHFVSDMPDEGLVAHVEAAFRTSQGDLRSTYRALLKHPAAWAPAREKVKQPFDFVTTSLRALGVSGEEVMALKPRDLRNGIARPMGLMGQVWEHPNGPDGWPEQAAHWINPQGLAARIQWALTMPVALFKELGRDLPDPRALAQSAMGAHGSEALHLAARGAPSRWEGIGLVLAAPEFQRR